MTVSADFSDLTTSPAVIERWVESGRPFEAGGVASFVAERSDGEPVLCLHGVPASAFLCRKVVVEETFRRPWSMEPFARGEDQLAAIADRVEQIAARARDAG